MNDEIFRRESRHGLLSPAIRHQLQVADASRAFAPEPPASRPLEQPANVPASAGPGGGGDIAASMYARALVKVWGVERAIAMCVAEGRHASADAIRAAQLRQAGM